MTISKFKGIQMKNIQQSLFVLTTLIFVTLISCEKNVVCDCVDDKLQIFTVVDEVTNLNLLNGDSKIFSFDKIDVFTIEFKNGHNFRKDFPIDSLQSDSTFAVRLDNQNVKRYFISFDLNDLDTIDISTRFLDGGCCGDRHLIDSLKFNGRLCDQNNHWILKK